MTGVSLVVFLLAIYLPHSFFKTWAERYVDLGRRRDASQFDELVTPIIPSIGLHLQALLVIFLVCTARNFLPVARGGYWSSRWFFPSVDWPLIFHLGTEQGANRLAHVLSDPYGVIWPISYIVVLTAVTFINAAGFGRGAVIGIYARADERIHPGARAIVRVRGWWQQTKLYISVSFYWLWKLNYSEYFVPLFPWTELHPFVFVKTTDGSLFHGRFVNYEKAGDGSIETITLQQVSRFSRRSIREAIRDGEHPLRPLHGTLLLKWSEVADLNTTVPGEIERLYKKYDRLRKLSVGPQELPRV